MCKDCGDTKKSKEHPMKYGFCDGCKNAEWETRTKFYGKNPFLASITAIAHNSACERSVKCKIVLFDKLPLRCRLVAEGICPTCAE